MESRRDACKLLSAQSPTQVNSQEMVIITTVLLDCSGTFDNVVNHQLFGTPPLISGTLWFGSQTTLSSFIYPLKCWHSPGVIQYPILWWPYTFSMFLLSQKLANFSLEDQVVDTPGLWATWFLHIESWNYPVKTCTWVRMVILQQNFTYKIGSQFMGHSLLTAPLGSCYSSCIM